MPLPSSAALDCAVAPWFALTVRPKHERLAERALRNQGFEVYLPVHRVKRRWSDRVKDADVILFPGYLFCRFSAVDKLRVMISPSVRGIVSTGRNPIAVDDSEVSSVRALIATGRPIDVCPFLRIGQHVRIQQGPFASVRGVIIRAQDNWRVVVSVAALGCSASIEVDADLIEPIAPVPERKPPTPVAPKRVTYGHYQA